MNNDTILEVNLEDLPDDQRALIDKATEEFQEKYLLSYSKTRDSVIQKTPLPRVLLHGQNDPNEEAEARIAAQMAHKTIHEAFTNYNRVLVNTISNVMKEVFFGALIDQVGPSYFNGYNPLAVGSSVTSSSQ